MNKVWGSRCSPVWSLMVVTVLTVIVTAQDDRMDIDDLKRSLDAGATVLLIDVREDHEVASGSIPGAIHIPVDELESRMSDIPKDVRLVFF